MFLENQEILIYIIFGSILLSIICIVYCFLLNSKLKKAIYKEANDIPESIVLIKQDIKKLSKFQNDMEKYLNTVEKRLQRSIQSSELIRFNPFDGIGSGGNQSFSLSFVNERGDGIVVSGLYYSNDRVSIFTKPIKAFSSVHELTDEERLALKKSEETIKN